MTFTSLPYMLFLAAVYFVFLWTPDAWRWLVLLSASYCFYLSLGAPYLIAVLACVTAISYLCGLRLAALADESRRKRCLWIGSGACVATLVLMKYLPFLSSGQEGRSPLLVTIGVSYFTFQAISYLSDVYLELETAETHLGRYALYLAFFPKLLQGPIERAGDLLPQLHNPYRFDYAMMRSGVLLFCWGLFKKVVIADRFAAYADPVFNNVHAYSGPSLLAGTYAYAFQLYFDFAAYTDMARGSGRLFGINLTENFNAPYLATSIADFWRRWHVSFSRWILDYIFKPLQMSWRGWGQAGTALALVVTFLASGVWHGATWGFVVWGGLHGVYLAVSTLYRPYQKKLHKRLNLEKSGLLRLWRVLLTFHLVCFAWVFFRMENPKDAVYLIGNIFTVTDFNSSCREVVQLLLGTDKYEILLLATGVIANTAVYLKQDVRIEEKPVWIKWPVVYALFFGVLFLGKFKQSAFIYFRF